MGLSRGLPSPALVVPDPETWLAWSQVPEDPGFEPRSQPAQAELLVAPEQVPPGLADAVRAAWELMPSRREVHAYGSALAGEPLGAVLGRPLASGDREGDGDEHDDGEDHEDMMAITGDPSADGLVMESMDLEYGPLSLALPGGLVVAATLDGDVVTGCQVRRTLGHPAPAAPPDPWGAGAWSAAELAAREALDGVAARPAARWLRLAGVEVERAVSHLAWLHGFMRLLGWTEPAARVRTALREATRARASLPVELAAPDLPDVDAGTLRSALDGVRSAAAGLERSLRRSASFARRTAGIGRLDAGDAAERGLLGPVARASGLGTDTRSSDPGYRALGFAPVPGGEGDARARALLRVAEVRQACELAAAAVDRVGTNGAGEAPVFSESPSGLAEGPRGPQRVLVGAAGEPERTAPGARAALLAAGELACGREWAAALVAIASLDLSPWRIGP